MSACRLEIRGLLKVFKNLTPTMSADGRVVIHLLTLKCGPPLDKESSREDIKLAERMASILKDFEARQLDVDEDEQLEVVEEEEEDWDPQDELMDGERQASSGHMITFSGGTLVSEERVRLQLDFGCVLITMEEDTAIAQALCTCPSLVLNIYHHVECHSVQLEKCAEDV
ncbi:unnamed protein product [Heligmosomoides polygyrus]|uniref:Uncharacterized protein n=1 Tax=Heligmosomoides polygyrus TaxID=6339 RepID=A0A183FMR4_HELPZ|nr:unnamed protein product [Heligmosomoides polygyrus]